MHYGEIKNCDIANGEGVRVTLFVSGCTNHCEHCFQPQTWDFDYGQPFTSETEQQLLDLLAPPYIQGLTLLGGEPFEPENQRVLVPFVRRVRETYPQKTVWAFSGFTLEELRTEGSHPRCEATDELLSMLDCLGARLRQYSKGDVIFHAGDPATHLGAVLTGQVQVSRTKADGQRVVMGEIRPGGLFAESFACARAESLPVTVTAAADAAGLLIDCGRISAPCSAACTFHTRLISNLLQVLAEKNLSLAGKLGHLSGRTIRERLLSYLEEQAARTGRATVTVPFDRQALADYLCVDRSALSRTIGALQREGVLTVRRDRFTLNF